MEQITSVKEIGIKYLMEEESLNARITLETNMSLKFLLKILPKNNNNNRISEIFGFRGHPFKMTPYHFSFIFRCASFS